jgi:hypothetical protein
MGSNYFESGLWNVVCDRCGSKLKNTEVKLEPRTGEMVCEKCWEPWHPQEITRPIPESQKLPFTRPEGTDTTSPAAPTNRGTVTMLAGALTAVITDSQITSSKRILITGASLDPKGVLSSRPIVSGSGTATVRASVAPYADWTIYYIVTS